MRKRGKGVARIVRSRGSYKTQCVGINKQMISRGEGVRWRTEERLRRRRSKKKLSGRALKRAGINKSREAGL